MSMYKGKIVVVDDEKIVTSAFKTLLKVEGFSDAAFFNNPLDAVEYLKTNAPDLVVSDFLMPEMNGLEFLTEVKKLYPEVSMILLTGYADKENAIRAINEVGLYKYIEKPWDNDDLLMNIKNGIERSHLLSDLRKTIAELEDAKLKLQAYSENLESLVAERTTELSEANAKLSGIVNYCADGIIIIDKNGSIIQVNPACENLIGLSQKALQKMKFQEIAYSHKPEMNSSTSNPEGGIFGLNADKTEVFLRDYFIVNKLSKEHIPVEISFAAISAEITVFFIASCSINLGELSEQQKVLLTTMLGSNEDLLGLVNALLEVYRFDSGKLELCKTSFSFRNLVEQCYDEIKPLAQKKNIEFVLDTDISPETEIFADKAELKRVIINLCGNAVNYTNKDGRIEIVAKIQSGDLIFSVTDNGNGIPKEDLPLLFKRFSQGTSRKRSTGTGLGLYLSRQIIEAHGGKIWAESKLDKGSEFTFLLTNVEELKKGIKEGQKIDG